MSFQIASAYVDIVARDNTATGLERTTHHVNTTLDESNAKTKKSFAGLSSGLKPIAVGIAGLFAVDKIGGFIHDSVAGWEDHQRVLSQTAAVIKSTGGAAGVTTKQMDDLSSKIESNTGVDGDNVLAGENMLLTFTNLHNTVGKGNDVFNQATQVVTDMSVAMGTDMKSQAIAVGKALNDPIAGIGALSRVGVTFTAGQKEQIKTMVQSGNTMGAQKVILGELNKEFGGSAKAQETSGQKMQVAMHNLQDTVGKALMPVITKLATFLTNDLVPAITTSVQWVNDNLVPAFKQVSQWVGDNVVPKLRDFGDTIKNVFNKGKEVIGPVIDMIKGLFSGSGTGDSTGFTSKIRAIGDSFGNVVDTVKKYVGVLLPIFEKIAGTLVDLFKKYEPQIKQEINQVFTIIKSVMDVIAAYIDKVTTVIRFIWDHAGKQILNIVKIAFGFIVTVIRDALKVVQGIINVVLGLLTGNWSKAWKGIQQILSGVWDAIKALVNAALAVLFNLISGALNILAGLFSKVWTTIKGIWNSLWNDLKSIFSTLWSGITTIVSTDLDAFKKLFSNIVKGIGTIWSGLKKVFGEPVWFVVHSIINPLINGADSLLTHLGLKIPKINEGSIPHFSTGGVVPGSHNRDDVPFFGTPGEVVVPKHVVGAYGGAEMLMSMLGFGRGGGPAHYGPGGILGSIGSGISSVAGSVVGGVKDFAGQVAGVVRQGAAVALNASVLNPLREVSKQMDHFGPVGKGMDHFAHEIINKLYDFIKGKEQKPGTALGVAGLLNQGSAGVFNPSGGVAQWAATVRQVLAMLHSPSSFDAVMARIAFESGGNPNAINLTDSNALAGHPSQGLMQTIPATFAAWAGPFIGLGITNGLASIYAGVNYADHRYGGMPDPRITHAGYDNGGLLPPGMTMALNRTGRNEHVLTQEQFENRSKDGFHIEHLNLNIDAKSVKDINDLVALFEELPQAVRSGRGSTYKRSYT